MSRFMLGLIALLALACDEGEDESLLTNPPRIEDENSELEEAVEEEQSTTGAAGAGPRREVRGSDG